MKKIYYLILSIGLVSNPVSLFSQNPITDYSQNESWSILSEQIDHQIDVFFVHPTTYDSPANGKYTADIHDAQLNEFTDKSAVDRYAKMFSDHCNVFAPRYQQVNIEVLAMDEKMKDHYLETPRKDIKAALIYYLKNLNNGRAFILAAHSQGSNLLHDILLENPDIIHKEKLVAAYLPGWTFTQEDIDKIGIPLSESADETACLMVWNTIGENGSSPTLMQGALCVNPLSWNTRQTEQDKTQNQGAVILTKNGDLLEKAHFTSARILDNGGLFIPKPTEIYHLLNLSMGPNCYHPYDYDFFFNNVKENVGVRCEAYLSGNK